MTSSVGRRGSIQLIELSLVQCARWQPKRAKHTGGNFVLGATACRPVRAAVSSNSLTQRRFGIIIVNIYATTTQKRLLEVLRTGESCANSGRGEHGGETDMPSLHCALQSQRRLESLLFTNQSRDQKEPGSMVHPRQPWRAMEEAVHRRTAFGEDECVHIGSSTNTSPAHPDTTRQRATQIFHQA